MNKIFIILFIICALFVVVSIYGVEKVSRLQQKVYQRKTISYSFTLKNFNNRTIRDVDFWAIAPILKASYQECILIESSHDYKLIKDKFLNQTLYFNIKELPPFSTKIINIQAVLKFHEKPIKETLLDIFLKPEKKVESNHEYIKEAALKFISVKDKPEKVYQWIKNNIRYSGFDKEEKGALYALKNRRGDCTEYMDSFTAILRSLGIPSRRIAGYESENPGVLRTSDYHNWSEFYEDKRWHLADCQKGEFKNHKNRYLIMRIINDDLVGNKPDFNRFKIEDINGVTAHMNN